MNEHLTTLAPSPVGAAPIVCIKGLTKEYRSGEDTIYILRGVDLNIYPGEMAAIMGPSGSGKSTFLFILGLLLTPSSGTYLAMGRNMWEVSRDEQAAFRRQHVGFVFQSCNLVENTTVFENLELPLIYAGVRRGERLSRIQEALARVNLTKRIHHPANRLSGGEQQRVAVARALVNHPRLVLADEPTGQLDRANGRLVLNHFQEITAGGQTAVMIVTHDPEVAEGCHRVYVLEDGILQLR